MTIQHKLILAFVVVVLLPGVAALYVQQSKMATAIYGFHEQKGRLDAERVLRFDLPNMVDAASNYVRFLALDSNMVKGAYYAASLGAAEDLKNSLPRIRSRLGLSFLEVLDRGRRVLYSTRGQPAGAVVKKETALIAGAGDGHVAGLEFNPVMGRFEIHAESEILRNGRRIGIVHGGYLFDRSQLAALGGDSTVALYHDETGSFQSSGALPLDPGWLKATFDQLAAACGGMAGACTATPYRHGRMTLDGVTFMVTTAPLLWDGRLTGMFISADNAGQMQRELAAARDSTILLGLGALSVALLLGFLIARSLSRPIIRLKEAALALGRGELGRRVEVGSADEIGVLAEAFNQMGARLSETTVSKRYMDNIIDSISDLLVVTDDAGVITRVNRFAAGRLGYEPGELIGRPVAGLGWDPAGSGIFSGGPASRNDWPHEETHYRTKDGREIPVHVSCARLSAAGDEAPGMVFVARDISARLRIERELQRERDEQQQLIEKLQTAQEQLLQSEKMASVGQLAAGVAHEINNPVGYISSNINSLGEYIRQLLSVLEAYESAEQLLAAHPETLRRLARLKEEVELEYLKEDVTELIEESREGVGRVRRIVQDLKEFSHVGEAQWQRADLHKGLDSTLNVARNELKYKAEIVKEYGDIPEVECVISQLNQVFMNILVNAAHAIEGRGTISVRTGRVRDQVWVEISDTGKGIAPEHLRRLFEPFFTTKPVGQGTGLGLSLSYGIVQKHGGEIEVESRVGEGTTFRIWLPVRQPQAVEAAAQHA